MQTNKDWNVKICMLYYHKNSTKFTNYKIFLYFSVNLREVKEVRPGKSSRDFDKWTDDTRRADANLCFVVIYGSDFKLKTLSIVGKACKHIKTIIELWSMLSGT